MTQTPDPAATTHRPVLVVDFGAQYAQLIARRVREANVYSEIVPHTASVADLLAKDPAAIILSGGPSSVYADGRPVRRPGAVRGRRAGARHLLRLPGDGRRARRDGRADRASASTAAPRSRSRPRARSWRAAPASQTVWMSHGDAVHAAPEGFEVLATSSGSPVAAFEDRAPPAVRRAVAPRGQALAARAEGARELPLRGRRAGARLERRQRRRGAGRADPRAGRRRARDLRAVRRRRLLGRRGARAEGRRRPADLRVRRPRAAARRARPSRSRRTSSPPPACSSRSSTRASGSCGALAGHTDPETKRKIIGREFIRVFEDAAREVVEEAGEHGEDVKFLVQGTLYPDVVESGGGEGAANIKSPPQRRRAAGRPAVRARRAAAHPVQGRGPRGRAGARRARGHRVAPAVPRPRPRHPDHRRGHRRAARHPARRRRRSPARS